MYTFQKLTNFASNESIQSYTKQNVKNNVSPYYESTLSFIMLAAKYYFWHRFNKVDVRHFDADDNIIKDGLQNIESRLSTATIS